MHAETQPDHVRLAYLTFVPEGDAVMVGRPDIGSYAQFPPDGAQAVQLLAAGASFDEVAAWFHSSFGTTLDTDDLHQTLEQLGFVATAEDEARPPGPVHWQRTGRAAFSAPAWCVYALSAFTAATLMALHPSLRPSYRDVFFTSHLWVIPLAMAAAQPPLMILHEGFHALAGRRLGLPSQLGIGRRLYFLVAETRLDALYSVPRSKRFLPFMAGIIADVQVLSWLVIASDILSAFGAPRWLSQYALALALTVAVRLLWQLFFFLETDLYYVISSVFGCSDLQSAARFRLYRLFRRATGQAVPDFDGRWSSRDLTISRWYAPLLFTGACAAFVNLAWVGIPSAHRSIAILAARFEHASSVGGGAVIDSVAFLLIGLAQVGTLAFVAIRDRRRARANSSPF